MNPNMREIVKEELQTLFNMNFIYPNLDSQWVLLLVIVPRKNGKWRICIDYQELNKETIKDNLPLPFIEQVLNTLEEKNISLFFMVLVDTMKSNLHLKIKISQHLPIHGVCMLTR